MRKNTGFTLIELMVVVVVMALLTGGGIVAFSRFRERRVVLREAQKVVDELRSAQRLAVAGNKSGGCSGTLRGYQVGFQGARVTTAVVCSGGTVAVETVNLDEVVVEAEGGITFQVLSGSVAEDAVISVRSDDGQRQFGISVTKAGSISAPEEELQGTNLPEEFSPQEPKSGLVPTATPTPTPIQRGFPTPPSGGCEQDGTC